MRHPAGFVSFVIAILAAVPALRAAPARQGPPADSGRALDRADLEQWLDSLVTAGLREGDIAGLVVSVVRRGEPLLVKGYGMADVGRGMPMTDSTVVRVASLSKTFTATAVMQLVEQGKLDLDRDVNDYLDFQIPPRFGKPITLRHLLTHTAGFEEIAYKRYRPPQSLRAHVAAVPDRIRPPGELPAYSNYSLALAGYIVARVSGIPFVDYVERRVLGAAGMRRSTFHTAVPAALLATTARTYPLGSAAPFSDSVFIELAPEEAPASGLATTARDMIPFMTAHLGDSTLLRAETQRVMQAPAFVLAPELPPLGLGMFRTDRGGVRSIGHSGDGEGAHAEMRLLPDEGIGIFVAMNSDGAATGLFPAAFTLRSRILDGFVARYFPAGPLPEEPTAPTAREHARLIAGEYAWSRRASGDFQEAIALIGRFALGQRIRALDDGTIETPAALSFETAGRTQRWREVAPFVWREVGGTARLVARVEEGRVRWVWTDQAAAVWVNVPVPTLLSARVNVPLLGGSAAVLVLAVLGWPVAAFLRRRAVRPDEPRVTRLTRWAALLGVGYLVGWAMVVGKDLASTVGAEPWIRLVQLIGVGVVAGAAVAAWNAVERWRRDRSGWVGKLASVAVALALADLVWVSFAFKLLSVSLP